MVMPGVKLCRMFMYNTMTSKSLFDSQSKLKSPGLNPGNSCGKSSKTSLTPLSADTMLGLEVRWSRYLSLSTFLSKESSCREAKILLATRSLRLKRRSLSSTNLRRNLRTTKLRLHQKLLEENPKGMFFPNMKKKKSLKMIQPKKAILMN